MTYNLHPVFSGQNNRFFLPNQITIKRASWIALSSMIFVSGWHPIASLAAKNQYTIAGKTYYILSKAENFHQKGMASWYGEPFHGRKTANGEVYNMYALTAAHKRLPLPTKLKVTNLNNQRSIIVRVNDRGPFVQGRIIDLSYAAALKLDIVKTGTAPVEISSLDNFDKTTKNLAQSSQMIIQVGAFEDISNARKLYSRIQSERLRPAFIYKDRDDTRKLWYKVRIGPFRDGKDIQQALIILDKLGIQYVTVN